MVDLIVQRIDQKLVLVDAAKTNDSELNKLAYLEMPSLTEKHIFEQALCVLEFRLRVMTPTS